MESDIREKLTQLHKKGILQYIDDHPECFDEVVQLALDDDPPYSWRAAWVLWSCIEPNDHRVKKHVKEIISILPKRKSNQQRELLKVLYHMDINDDQEGFLFDLCIRLWERTDLQPSVRYNAFKVILKIAKKTSGHVFGNQITH